MSSGIFHIPTFRNDALLTDLERLQRPFTLGGINESAPGLLIEFHGRFGELTGVHHSPSASANVLAQGHLVDFGWKISYDQREDNAGPNIVGN